MSQWDKFENGDAKFSAIDQGQYPDNISGITSRALDIEAHARDLNYVIQTLRAVNMDRLADEVSSVKKSIIDLVQPIPGLVNKELDQGLAHGREMMSGLLMVGLKMARLQDEAKT